MTDHDAHPPDQSAADDRDHSTDEDVCGHGVHTHDDGTTHAHGPQRHAKLSGFLARLFGAPG